jgi:general secretion pathway protein D
VSLRSRSRFGLFRACGRFCLAFAAAGLTLAGCSGLQKLDEVGAGGDISEAVRTSDLTARVPVPQGVAPSAKFAARERVFPAAPTQVARTQEDPSPDGKARPAAAESYNLSFENAQITAVAQVLLGDILKVGYAIDQRVQGTISLSSGRPVPADDILPLFESVLKLNGASLVREGAIYKIIPAGEATGAGSVRSARRDEPPEPGFGISVLPLRYTTAPMVQRAIESFATRPGAVRADETRNILLFQGSSTERASAIEAALALDVDTMKDQAVGIFPLHNVNADAIIGELQNLFPGGPQGAVRFQPIARLNAVLAVARTTAQISTVRSWIARLDHNDANVAMHVYHVRFANTRTIANLLRETMGASGATETAEPPTSQTAGLESLASTTGSGGAMRGPQPNAASPAESQPVADQRRPNAASGSVGRTSEAGAPPGKPLPLLANVRVSADAASNTLVIYANTAQYRVIERALLDLDRPPLQVAIHATVAEVTLNDNLQYGLQFFLHSEKGSVGYGDTAPLQALIPGFNAVLGKAVNPKIVIDALRQLTTVKVLSSPSLVVLDNQTATLQVGDQVPIVTRTAQGLDSATAPIVNNVEMRDTGVILRVTPRINAEGVVTLDVQQEVSEVATATSSTSTTQQTLTPTISQRRVKSSVAVPDGQTVLLGGLITSNQQKSKSGLPLPFDLRLMGTNSGTVASTELIIFIRPEIIRDALDAQLVAEELRSKMRQLTRDMVPERKP